MIVSNSNNNNSEAMIPSSVNEDSNYYSDDENSSSSSATCTTILHPVIQTSSVSDISHGGRCETSSTSVTIVTSDKNGQRDGDEGRHEDMESSHVLQLQSDPESIMYRGEGNSSLVVALRKDGKVIRILKGKLEKNHSSSLTTSCPSDDSSLTSSTSSRVIMVRDRLEDFIDFNQNVLRRIFNNSFLDLPQLIFLDKGQVDVIKQIATTCRPDHRLNKIIPMGGTYALLLPDYCALPRVISNRYHLEGPVISAEIKPKQGFLPSADTLPFDLAIKSNICRFCLKQFHKIRKGSITRKSDYCPLDLFSGCPERQMLALKCLLKTPQNNLRIFKDLQLVYGEGIRPNLTNVLQHFILFQNNCDGDDDLSTTGANKHQEDVIISNCDVLEDIFCRLLLKALISPVKKNFRDQEKMIIIEDQNTHCDLHSDHVTRCCKDNCDGQPKHGMISSLSVLGSVYAAQKLDSVDSHGALEMARYLNQERIPNLMTELKNKERRPASIGSPHRLPSETLDEYFFRKVWEFIVSLTAKDCSIMITLQRVCQNDVREVTSEYEDSDSSCDSHQPLDKYNESLDQNLIRDEMTGQLYAVSVAITDLDPKLPETFSDLERKMRQKDYLMIASFQESKREP